MPSRRTSLRCRVVNGPGSTSLAGFGGRENGRVLKACLEKYRVQKPSGRDRRRSEDDSQHVSREIVVPLPTRREGRERCLKERQTGGVVQEKNHGASKGPGLGSRV